MSGAERRLDTARLVAWRYAADLRRLVNRSGSARSALESLRVPSRSHAAAWEEATRVRHDDYRRAHPIADGRVAIVCVSMRPQLLDSVVANIARQLDVELDIVFVANAPNFDMRAVERAFADLPGTVVLHPRVRTSLGSALNRAMEQTDARFVAKFDDDDLYGPYFLADSLRAHGYAGASVVGKHTYYARIARDRVDVRPLSVQRVPVLGYAGRRNPRDRSGTDRRAALRRRLARRRPCVSRPLPSTRVLDVLGRPIQLRPDAHRDQHLGGG